MWSYRERNKRVCKRRSGKRVQMATQIVRLLHERKIDSPTKLYLRVMVHQSNRKLLTTYSCIKFAENDIHLEEFELYELYELCGYNAYEYTPNQLYKRFYKDLAQLVWYNTHNLENTKLQNKFYDEHTPLPTILTHRKRNYNKNS